MEKPESMIRYIDYNIFNILMPPDHMKSCILINLWHYFPLPSWYDVIVIKHIFFFHCSKLWIEEYQILSFWLWGKAFSSYCLHKAWEINVPTYWYTNQLTDICKGICLSFFFALQSSQEKPHICRFNILSFQANKTTIFFTYKCTCICADYKVWPPFFH